METHVSRNPTHPGGTPCSFSRAFFTVSRLPLRPRRRRRSLCLARVGGRDLDVAPAAVVFITVSGAPSAVVPPRPSASSPTHVAVPKWRTGSVSAMDSCNSCRASSRTFPTEPGLEDGTAAGTRGECEYTWAIAAAAQHSPWSVFRDVAPACSEGALRWDRVRDVDGVPTPAPAPLPARSLADPGRRLPLRLLRRRDSAFGGRCCGASYTGLSPVSHHMMNCSGPMSDTRLTGMRAASACAAAGCRSMLSSFSPVAKSLG